MTPEPTTTPGSILGRMRTARQEIVERLHVSIKVPHWDDTLPDGTRLPEVYARYRAIPLETLTKGFRKIDEAKAADRGQVEMEVNLDHLAQSMVGVYAVLDGVAYTLDGKDAVLANDADKIDEVLDEHLTPIGAELAFQIGAADTVEDGQRTAARRIIRTLFFHDGDIVYHGNRVGRFSGYRDANADEEFSGKS